MKNNVVELVVGNYDTQHGHINGADGIFKNYMYGVNYILSTHIIDPSIGNVKFVKHWSIGKYESCRKGIIQWNNQRECTLNMKFMPQISDKWNMNCSDNHIINLHSLINNTMIIQ